MSEEPRSPEAPTADPAGDLDEDEVLGADIPEDAFYSPDDPIVRAEGEIPDDAIYSPDEPLTRSEELEGVVTTMSGLAASELGGGGDLQWEIRRVTHMMEALARDLKEHGMEALKVHPETEPMDAMLRSYIAGYLVGRTEEE